MSRVFCLTILLDVFSYIAVWFLISHQVNNICSWADVEELHSSIVHWNEVHEQVQVPEAEYNQIDFLSLTWNT